MMLHVLNELVKDTPCLLESAWKPDFKLVCLAPETQINFTKKNNFEIIKKIYQKTNHLILEKFLQLKINLFII